ncbi:MAG: uracil-DNA glycosylase [Pseudomonadota bacterium]|nr:uracil-DNA glycosylase [Pseudomonadota bacterium]|tara:strand:- start:1641 stop:2294 length:654 start_codon:yes stop_codon:yes gene_type:complete
MDSNKKQRLSLIGITRWELNKKLNNKKKCSKDESFEWETLAEMTYKCAKCDLHKSRIQVVFGSGRRDAKLLIIGEAPGAEEDKQGKPFVGRSGKLLNSMLKAININREDTFITNILKCRPPKNRDPQIEEIDKCRSYLIRQIELIKPKIVLTLGKIASQIILDSDETIGEIRGKKIFSNIIKMPVVASYHPAYLLRNPSAKEKSWEDLKIIKKAIGS